MNLRIRKIRKDFELTQEEFGSRLGIKRNTVATYEMGRSTPVDAVVSLICREFNVNEEWLRHGTGDPYHPPYDNLISTAASLLGKHDPLFESLVEAYGKLSDQNKDVLINFMQDLAKTYNSKKSE